MEAFVSLVAWSLRRHRFCFLFSETMGLKPDMFVKRGGGIIIQLHR
jgi:hypothetical protein